MKLVLRVTTIYLNILVKGAVYMEQIKQVSCVGCSRTFTVINFEGEQNSTLYCSQTCKNSHSLFNEPLREGDLDG